MSRGSSSARIHRYRAEATTSASSMWPAASRTDHSDGAGLARSRSPAPRKVSRRAAGVSAWTSAGSSSPSFARRNRWYSAASATGSGDDATTDRGLKRRGSRFMSLPRPRITAMRFAAPRSPEGLAEAMDRTVSRLSAASAELLRWMPKYDEQKLWRHDGATSMSSWLAARYGLAWGTAREWVRVAHALERLPRIAQAYASGGLSWDQLGPLTRFASAETDARWAGEAPHRRPAWLWREARRHEQARTQQAEEARRRRYLDFNWDHDRSVLWLAGMLPAEEGTALQRALARRAERVPADPEAVDPAGARLADALVDMVTGEPEPTTLVVHAGAEALAGAEPTRGPWLAETEGGQRLPSEAVRRLACDGRIEWVLEREGRPVGMGRRGRTVRGQVLRVLRYRDGAVCRFPGCERKRWLNAHHLVHWADGGATNLDNLVLLCHAHHRLIHEGGWRTSGHPARELRFHDPGGRPLRTNAALVPT